MLFVLLIDVLNTAKLTTDLSTPSAFSIPLIHICLGIYMRAILRKCLVFLRAVA